MRQYLKRGFALVFLFSFLFPLFVLRTDAADLTTLQWGFAGADGIRVPGWNHPDGNMEEEIIVAVMDGGIDYTHPDLKDIVYTFSEEEQAALGCGKYGYDATTGKNNDPPLDDHASHVAGIIAASWNGFGVSGVCSRVKIINIRCSVGNDTPLDYCLEGYAFIKRALDYGIPIRAVNNSWGNVDSSMAMNEMVEAVGRAGCLSVFSAGNYGDNLEDTIFQPGSYFAASPYALVVGACDRNGVKASFSSYGEAVVDLYAPGVNIYSAMRAAYGSGYDYMNGTSMACPAVTGAAAFLAGNHPEITSAEDLKTYLLSCVRPTDGLDTYYGNGILDLSVEESGDYAPVITALSASGNTVLIRGVHFGTERGTLLLFDDANNTEQLTLTDADISWTDTEIRVTVASGVPAVLRVYLETAHNQKHDAAVVFTKKSARVFEDDLSLPQGADQPDKIDAAADYQAAGFLGGIEGKLYYMPMVFLEEDIVLAYDLLFSYDFLTDTWETLSPLPEKVLAVQAVVYDGSILIAGVNRDLTHAVAYRYDVARNRWQALNAEQIPLYATLVNADDTLLLVGGAADEAGKKAPLATVLSYDPESGACQEVYSLQAGVWGAQAVYGNETLYVYGHVTGADGVNRQIFQRVRDGVADIPENAFPPFRKGEGNRRPKFNTALHGALCTGSDGVYLTGPLSEDGTADTYLMKYEEDAFLPYEKRLSDAPAFWPAACAYSDYLYAIARSATEPGFALFRRTPVATFTHYTPPEPPPEETAEIAAASSDASATDAAAAGTTGAAEPDNAEEEKENAGKDRRMVVALVSANAALLLIAVFVIRRALLRRSDG